MLAPEFLRARIYKGQLKIVPLSSAERTLALDYALLLLQAAQDSLGKTRLEWDELLTQYRFSGTQKKLFFGLRQFLEQTLEFGSHGKTVDSVKLRQKIFLAAANKRKEARIIKRAEILLQVAEQMELDVDTIEQSLYADLNSEQTLVKVPVFTAEELVHTFEEYQLVAVLLCAGKFTIEVKCKHAADYRTLLHRLKNSQLLSQIEKLDHGYRLEIIGFLQFKEDNTKYYEQCSYLFSALKQYADFSVQAVLQFGKSKQEVSFNYHDKKDSHFLVFHQEQTQHVTLIEEFIEKFSLLKSATFWKPFINPDILHHPNGIVSLPDLQFIHQKTKEVIYLECLGYWSHEGLRQRIEFLTNERSCRIIIAANERSCLSAEGKKTKGPTLFYLYKNHLQPIAILERIEKMSQAKIQETLW